MAILITGMATNAAQAQSSGHWVSDVPAGRGFFARVEALWLKRDESKGATLATLNSSSSPGRPSLLRTEDVDIDFETGVRVLAGTMLNQCTQIEVEYFGIDSFNGNEATLVRPAGPFALNSVYTLLNQTPLAYKADGESALHNGEINLRRTGGSCDFTTSALVGFRYMHIRDQLKLDTFGPSPAAATPVLAFESTSTDTRNNIFALQLGGDLGIHREYFSLTAGLDAFLYANFYDSDARNVVSDPTGFFLVPAGGGTFRDSSDEDKKATMGIGTQINIDAAINITQNIILHGGYNFLVLSNVALGAEQLPEVRPAPARGARISNPDRGKELGHLFYHGPSAGLEIRW
ncbi:MAG: BBP7 family outer membrane beta-barrel protein [Planctomycetaceae bacterium]|nr:BBP7 family outer membrane beta-barrel protein [Planctomycetaceae bacterium]